MEGVKVLDVGFGVQGGQAVMLDSSDLLTRPIVSWLWGLMQRNCRERLDADLLLRPPFS